MMNRFFKSLFNLAGASILVVGSAFASNIEPEAPLPAAKVTAGATAFSYTATREEMITGFFIRLTNCVPPQDEPVVAALRVRGELLSERVSVPAFPRPLGQWTMNGRKAAVPLDVGQEYRKAINPVKLIPGDRVDIEIVSAPEMQSGITVGLQRQGKIRLDEMRNPFREVRLAGPVSRIPWSPAETIAVGNHIKFDPECAPQNNSSIIADPDGTLYQFTAYYSVDEQYGGGRAGSLSRIFGFRKRPDAGVWERLGVVIDVPKGETYAGDPFVFYDLEGTPCILYTVCDGTNGFVDWKLHDLIVRRSETKSFAGPWGEPHSIFLRYPRDPDDNKNGGRANCGRLYTREKTKDYVLFWNHGAGDMDIRGAILPDLETTLTHRQIGDAPIVARNQEEGGGGFQFDDKGYYSTWQIPGVNDPTGIQRVYEFDLDDPLNPESWRVVSGSLGFNAGSIPSRDGGCTADAWAVSKIGDRLCATVCEWSVSTRKNYLVAIIAPWKKAGKSLSCRELGDGIFRFGIPRVQRFHEVAPVVEYAVGKECSLQWTARSEGENAWHFLLIGPSQAPLTHQCLGLRVSPSGSQFVLVSDGGSATPLTENVEPKWEPGREFQLKLRRNGKELTGFVDGRSLGKIELDEETAAWLETDVRFKTYGWQGGVHFIKDAVLIDGPE